MILDDVMLDFETASTASNGAILSIGAVRFSLEGEMDDMAFYGSISLESNLELGRIVDEDTLRWWMRQAPQAQVVWHEPKEHIASVFQAFNEWLGTHGSMDNRRMWSNGADFDLPMAASVYRQLGLPTPWHFWNNRCFRTFKTLPGAQRVKRPDVGVKHNALDDAIAQVKHAQAIHKALFT